METTERFLRAKRIGAVLAYATLLVLSAVIIRQDNLKHAAAVREQVADDVRDVAHGLAAKFFWLEVFADRLGTVAGISGDVPEEMLARTAQELLNHRPDINAVAIAPGMTITHIAPLEGACSTG